MSKIASELKPKDFFKTLKITPQEIEITHVEIVDTLGGFNEYSYLKLTMRIINTNQTTTYCWKLYYADTSTEYYISMEDELHPLLAYESGLEGTALIYWDEELLELLTGLKFKAKAQIKQNRKETKYILYPVTEPRRLQ